MKLLDAQEVKSQLVKRQESEALELARLHEQTITKAKRLNELEADGQARLAAIKAEIASNEALLMGKVSQMQKEVYALEERRKEALKPLELIKNELSRIQQDQNERAQFLDSKERELEKFRGRLKRLDDKLEDREYAVADSELDISKRLKDLVTKEEALSVGEKAFNQRLLEANETHKTREKSLSEKEAVLVAGMDWVKRREEALKEERKQLEAEKVGHKKNQMRLAAQYERLRDKGLIK